MCVSLCLVEMYDVHVCVCVLVCMCVCVLVCVCVCVCVHFACVRLYEGAEPTAQVCINAIL